MTCDDFLKDPAACAAHAEECEKCRELQRELDRLDSELGGIPITPDRSVAGSVSTQLPLAPWEGAGHRGWGVIIGAVVLLVAIASAAFVLSGVSPLRGFEAAMTSSVPKEAYLNAGGGLAQALRNAPPIVHFAIVAIFVIVNVALFILLRRPTRGYDVAGR